ncbi:S-layer homology domain-containing protein [Paenibacillus sp. FSL R10-2734]|uniref:S-layer homology domain-containing protein n=1 Tax=Paenibacillus sp. FSL R10-2734 TaxID=2954691 RepID=UPI0030D6D5D7
MNRLFKQAVSVTLAFVMVLGLTFTGMPAYAEDSNGEAGLLQLQTLEPVTILAGNSTWKYLDQGTDQGTAWRSVYDDSTWASGQAPLGYKDSGAGVSSKQFGALNTNISYGSNKSKKYPTSYFRTNVTVNMEEVLKSGEIEGNFAFDDGVVLYLNGTEIYREAMPTGDINFQTKSPSNLSNPNEYTKVDLTEVVKTNLKDGNNELSAEVHQSSDSSSDLYWAMSLTAYPAVEPVQPGVGKPDSIALTFNGNPQTSMGFNWYAPESVTGTKLEVVEASKVVDGQFPSGGAQSYEGTSVTTSVYMTKADKSAKKSVVLTSHKVIADHLQPGTEYAYRAGDGQADNWSNVGTFKTESSSNQAFKFLYTTDSQGTTEEDFDIWNHTLQEGLAKFPTSEFILNSGDLVDNGDIEEQWGWFFNKPKDILANIPLVPLVGNHESKTYNNYTTHFNLPNVSNTGAKPDGSVYSFDYGSAHFMVINTEYYGASSNLENNEIYNKQVQWLRSEAAKSDQKWKVVLLHKSPYSVASHTNDTDVLYYRANLTKVFDELGIDMVIGGHDHTFARSYQMYNNKPLTDIVPDTNGVVTDPKGTLYLITNAAGNKKYNVASGAFPFAAKYGQPGKEMFTGMTVTNDELSYEAYTTITGGSTDLYDKYSIQKSDVTVKPVQNAKAAVADGGKITLTWDAPTSGAPVSGYRIYEQNDLLSANWAVSVPTTEGQTSYSYSVENTDPNKIYQFVIKAVSDRTNSDATIVSTDSIKKVTVTFNGDPVSSKGFTWYTASKSTGSDLQVVENTGDTPDFAKSSEFKGRSAVSRNSKDELVHKAEASGLKADTKYYFRVGDKSLGLWSEVGTFETAAKTGAFTFIDLADTQAKTEDEAILSGETMAKALTTFPNAEFVAINGDIVDTGTNESQWNWLLGHSQETLLNTTIVPVAGNHEDKANAFYEHYNIKEAAGSPTETGAYYSYDYSNAHFVVLNTNENSDEFANFSEAQLNWMKADVKAAKAAGAKWIIVAMHKGPYTTSNHATDKDIMGANGERAKVAPMMAELGIDLVLQGHDHIYARTKPIKADGTAADTVKIKESFNGQTVEYTVNPDGTIYLIPATAGAKVYYKNMKPELGEAYYNLFEVANENTAAKYGADPSDATRPMRGQVQTFVGITVDAGKLTAVSYEIDQRVNDAKPYVLEEFGIVKESVVNPPEPTIEPTIEPTTEPTTTPTPAPSTTPTTGPTAAPTTKPTASPTPTVAPTATPAPTTAPSPTVSPVIKPSLTDTSSHWAAAVIEKALAAGFVSGYPDDTFRPNQKVNRVEFITMLARALQLPDNGDKSSFKDSAKIPAWAKSFVAQAVSLQIISGYDDGTFRPTQELTRTELAVMVVRALGITVDPKATLTFNDAKEVPAWAVPYIAAAAKSGLVNGVGQNQFAPNQKATRAEAVTIILALLEKGQK